MLNKKIFEPLNLLGLLFLIVAVVLVNFSVPFAFYLMTHNTLVFYKAYMYWNIPVLITIFVILQNIGYNLFDKAKKIVDGSK